MKIASRLALLLYIVLSPVLSQAQAYSISGRVIDAKDTGALTGVTVLMAKIPDSTRNGAITDADGNFSISGIAPGTYSFRLDYLGYRSFTQTLTVTDRDIVLGTIKMTTETRELKGVTVAGRQLRATQNGDTSQFNADAFKTNRDASAEDLVTKMPGVSSDNSGVKVNGENVQQIYVDGKPFFGTDPTLALKNLPAEVIDKIQVFDKLSDQSTFTGFDDGNTQKTMNIITRRNKSEGIFGKVYAGYGTDDRYIAGGNLNIFDGDRRISLLALSNNINQQNFSSEDLLGVSGGGSGQNRGGFGRGGSSRGNFGGGGFGGGGGNNFLVGQQGGITTTNSAGINYSDTWAKKIKVSGSYFFNGTDNTNRSQITRNYFTRVDTGSGLLYQEDDHSEVVNYNHRFNLRMEYNIDSFNSIIFTPSISFQNNNNATDQYAYTDSLGYMLSSTRNTNVTKNNGYSSANNLLLQHKFKKQRRTISLNINSSLNEKTGDGSYVAYDTTFHYDGGPPYKDTILDQRYDLYNHGYTLGSNVTYTEPVGKNGQLMANYYPSVNKSYSDRETFDKVSNAELLNTSLSNKFNSTYITQKGGLSYRAGDKKLTYTLGANIQYATLEGERIFPQVYNIERNFTNILPTATLNYRYTDGRNLRIMYRTNTTAPSVTQLQDVADITNPLLIKTGNLTLQQDYEHTLTMRYGLTKGKTARNFFVFAYANYISNYIGNATYFMSKPYTFYGPLSTNPVFVPANSQLTLPVNLQNYWNARTFATYGMPVDVIKCNLNLNGGFSYVHTPGMINNVLNYSENYVPSFGVVLSSNISEKVDFTLSYNGNYNVVKNSLQKSVNNNYYSHVAALRFNWLVFDHFVFNTNFTHNYYTAFSSTGDQSYFLWNAYVGYKLLKSRALEARISAFDILDQNKSITRTVTDLYIENSTTEVLKRYFMFQLTYTIRNFKGQMPTTSNEDNRPNWRVHTH